MKARSAVLALALAASGCSSLTNPGSATFREPAARMASALQGAAARPSFVAQVPAESIHDARIAGGRVLLDYRSETGAQKSFDAHATCGPLELRDVAENKRVWSVERPEACSDQILAVAPRLAILGTREEGGKSGLFLLAFATDTGAAVARIPLEKGAFAVPSGDALLVVQGAQGAQRVSLHDGDKLTEKWKLALSDTGAVASAITLGGAILVFGGSVTAIDRATGQKLRATSLGADALALDVRPVTDAAYAFIVRAQADTAVAKVGADGTVAWTSPVKGLLDAVAPTGVFVIDGAAVTALRPADGTVAWTAQLPAAATGGGLVVPQGKGALYLVPHAQGVTALDAASGAVRFNVSPFGSDSGEPHATDRLSLAGETLVILDTARGVAGLDLASEGRPRYAFAVRSLPHAHRRARVQAAFGKYDIQAQLAAAQTAVKAGEGHLATVNSLSNFTGGGMVMATAQMSIASANYLLATQAIGFAAMTASMNARRSQQAEIALRQAKLDDESPLILRPISWALGRGLLVIRKSDGVFREIVTGPPDVYEDAFRPASIAAVVPLAKMILTFSEGVDPSLWQDSPERAPVQLVARSLLGYALDEASFLPASEYEKRSVVAPIGSAPIASAPSAPSAPPAATPTPAAAPSPSTPKTATPAAPATAAPSTPKTATPAAPPAPATCRTHLDCKGGLVCPRGQCVAPACVADRDCGAGQYCSLEGACEPLKR